MLGFATVRLFLARLIDFYQILILVWCIASWFPKPRDGVLADLLGALDALVRPFIELFRRIIPPFGAIDFSPIVGMFVLVLIERMILLYL